VLLYLIAYNALEESDVYTDAVLLVRLCIVEKLCNSCGVSFAEANSNSHQCNSVCTEAYIRSSVVAGRGVRTQPLFLIYTIGTKIRDMWRQPAFSCSTTDYRGVPVTGMLYHHKCSEACGRYNRLM